MAGNVKNMGLASLDDLFKSEQERQQDTHERILNIPVGEIYPYARQPYSIKRPTPDLVRLNANTEQQKKELFGKVCNGEVRILLGSTAKMGAGTNVQKKLVALHHLDCPWRPADLQQREGRIIRQGNENKEVEIYTYVYLLRRYKRPTRKRISYEMRREVLRLERYQAQFLYLHEHGISTVEQLMERQVQIEQEIQQRTELRQPLYTKRRYETDEKIKEELAREIDRQTTSLRELRKERTLCKRIEQQVPGIQQNLREFEENKSQNQKEVIRHEYQRRNR